jgi:cobalt/nickel transport protein
MSRREILLGLLLAVFLAGFVSIFASYWPDGLEKVAEDKGFLQNAKAKPLISSPMPDYTLRGIRNKKLSTSVAGIAGVLLVFGIGYGSGVLLRRCKH